VIPLKITLQARVLHALDVGHGRWQDESFSIALDHRKSLALKFGPNLQHAYKRRQVHQSGAHLSHGLLDI
jgi:hypothetical protein